MKFLLSLIFALFNTFSFAQNMYLAKPVTHFVEVYDEKGNLLAANVGSIKGSPLWKDEWCNASVEMYNGKRFSNMKLIVNLVNGNIHFLQTDAEFQFVEPIKNMTLYYNNEATYDSIQLIKLSPTDVSIYELKANGPKYQLLNLMTKNAVDTYDYGKSSGGKMFEIFKESFLYNIETKELISTKGKTLLQLFKNDAEAITQRFSLSPKKKQLSVKDISTIVASW